MKKTILILAAFIFFLTGLGILTQDADEDNTVADTKVVYKNVKDFYGDGKRGPRENP